LGGFHNNREPEKHIIILEVKMADKSDDDIRRKELEDRYKSIKKKAEYGLSWGAGFMKDMNEISDAASLGMEAAKFGSIYADWELAIGSVERLDEEMDQIVLLADQYGNFYIPISSFSASAISSGSGLVSGTVSMFDSETEWQDASRVNAAYGKYFEKYNLKDHVLKRMIEFGFTGSQRGRNAIEKFKRGWEMYYMSPPGTDTSAGSVLPIRQSIKLSIDELLALRPVQQEAKRKIVAIGLQLKVDSIGIDMFEEMQEEFRKLFDKLSATKDELFSRDKIFEMMRDGTLFLRWLLLSIDPQKLRKRRASRKSI
jgi:hypothetical protein